MLHLSQQYFVKVSYKQPPMNKLSKDQCFGLPWRWRYTIKHRLNQYCFASFHYTRGIHTEIIARWSTFSCQCIKALIKKLEEQSNVNHPMSLDQRNAGNIWKSLITDIAVWPKIVSTEGYSIYSWTVLQLGYTVLFTVTLSTALVSRYWERGRERIYTCFGRNTKKKKNCHFICSYQ